MEIRLFWALKASDYFGEMSFVDMNPAKMQRFRQRKNPFIAHLQVNKFKDIIASNPEIVFNLMKGLLVKPAMQPSRLEAFAFKTQL
ncbi:MAG: hypothetical protein R2941_14640 [Desulfobacterales bacterium]